MSHDRSRFVFNVTNPNGHICPMTVAYLMDQFSRVEGYKTPFSLEYSIAKTVIQDFRQGILYPNIHDAKRIEWYRADLQTAAKVLSDLRRWEQQVRDHERTVRDTRRINRKLRAGDRHPLPEPPPERPHAISTTDAGDKWFEASLKFRYLLLAEAVIAGVYPD
jgi:hypothetical protein